MSVLFTIFVVFLLDVLFMCIFLSLCFMWMPFVMLILKKI